MRRASFKRRKPEREESEKKDSIMVFNEGRRKHQVRCLHVGGGIRPEQGGVGPHDTRVTRKGNPCPLGEGSRLTTQRNGRKLCIFSNSSALNLQKRGQTWGWAGLQVKFVLIFEGRSR